MFNYGFTGADKPDTDGSCDEIHPVVVSPGSGVATTKRVAK